MKLSSHPQRDSSCIHSFQRISVNAFPVRNSKCELSATSFSAGWNELHLIFPIQFIRTLYKKKPFLLLCTQTAFSFDTKKLMKSYWRESCKECSYLKNLHSITVAWRGLCGILFVRQFDFFLFARRSPNCEELLAGKWWEKLGFHFHFLLCIFLLCQLASLEYRIIHNFSRTYPQSSGRAWLASLMFLSFFFFLALLRTIKNRALSRTARITEA